MTDHIFITILHSYVKFNNNGPSVAGQMQNLFIVPHLMPSPHMSHCSSLALRDIYSTFPRQRLLLMFDE